MYFIRIEHANDSAMILFIHKIVVICGKSIKYTEFTKCTQQTAEYCFLNFLEGCEKFKWFSMNGCGG